MFVQQQIEDRVTMRQPSHFTDTFKSLSSFRKDGTLCDVSFLVDGKKFNAHKSIMSSCSDYFKAMFTGKLVESKQTEIILESISSEVFEQIIEFIYEGSFTIDMLSVVDMVHASSLLLLKDITNECFQFLKKNLSLSNCLRVRNIGVNYDDKDLVLKCTDFIKRNFEKLVSENEVLNLGFGDLKTLLSFDDIVCKTEDTVALLLQKWLKVRQDVEVNEVRLLFKTIRVKFLSREGLSSLQAALKELAGKHSYDFVKMFACEQKLQSRSSRRQTICRTSQRTEEVVFCLGKHGETYCYDIPTKRFRRLERFPVGRQPGELCVANNKIYACGGTQNVSVLHTPTSNMLYCYDVSSGHWSQLASMAHARYKHCSAFLHDCLYVLGGKGEDRTNNLEKTVECYDTKTKSWSQKTIMTDPRVSATATASKKHVYVIGGEGSSGIRGLKTAERYCPRKEKWERLPDLNHERILSSAVFFNEKVFVFGGGNGIFDLNNFEFLESNESQWTVVTVPYATPIHCALAVQDKILAIGSSAWGDDLVLQCSVVGRRGVHWKHIKEFIHPSHRTKSMKYEIISLLNYEIQNQPETQCDCNYYDEDSSDGGGSLQSSLIDSDDDEGWMDLDPWGIWV